jgi:hypothetical protein
MTDRSATSNAYGIEARMAASTFSPPSTAGEQKIQRAIDLVFPTLGASDIVAARVLYNIIPLNRDTSHFNEVDRLGEAVPAADKRNAPVPDHQDAETAGGGNAHRA